MPESVGVFSPSICISYERRALETSSRPALGTHLSGISKRWGRKVSWTGIAFTASEAPFGEMIFTLSLAERGAAEFAEASIEKMDDFSCSVSRADFSFAEINCEAMPGSCCANAGKTGVQRHNEKTTRLSRLRIAPPLEPNACELRLEN